MYDIKIDRADNNSLTVTLDKSNGYYIQTIDGLTGVSASFESVKAVSGYGESITGKTIPPKSLMVTGLVLDANTMAKQKLLNVLVAGAEVLVTIYQGYSSGAESRPSVYRQAKAFVKQSPIITQERHSKFSFTLTMPNPYWEDVEETTILVPNSFPNTAPTITGDVPPEFTFSYKTTNNSYGATLNCGTSIVPEKYLYFNYSVLSDGYLPAGSTVRLWRDNGRLRFVRTAQGVTEENIIQALYTNSSLWYLMSGNIYKYWLSADGTSTNAAIKYRPLYSGVLVDGV